MANESWNTTNSKAAEVQHGIDTFLLMLPVTQTIEFTHRDAQKQVPGTKGTRAARVGDTSHKRDYAFGPCAREVPGW